MAIMPIFGAQAPVTTCGCQGCNCKTDDIKKDEE